MGDINQYKWVKRYKEDVKPPVLEIGSRFYSDATFMNYRDLFKGLKYIGADLSEGKNVDVVLDFTEDINSVQEHLGSKFNCIICCSVMEHVKDIFTFAKNVTNLLNVGGKLFLSVPFTWEFHGYPNDYWRFTPPAIEYLFPELNFPKEMRTISSHLDNDIQELDEDPNPFTYKMLINGTNKPIPKKIGISKIIASIIQLLKYEKITDQDILFNSLTTTRLFRPSCINMVGIKK